MMAQTLQWQGWSQGIRSPGMFKADLGVQGIQVYEEESPGLNEKNKPWRVHWQLEPRNPSQGCWLWELLVRAGISQELIEGTWTKIMELFKSPHEQEVAVAALIQVLLHFLLPFDPDCAGEIKIQLGSYQRPGALKQWVGRWTEPQNPRTTASQNC